MQFTLRIWRQYCSFSNKLSALWSHLLLNHTPEKVNKQHLHQMTPPNNWMNKKAARQGLPHKSQTATLHDAFPTATPTAAIHKANNTYYKSNHDFRASRCTPGNNKNHIVESFITGRDRDHHLHHHHHLLVHKTMHTKQTAATHTISIYMSIV